MIANNSQKISKWLLYISTFLIPFYFFRFSILNIPTNIFEIAVLVSALFFFCTNGVKSISKKSWVCVGILIFILVISILISPDKKTALGIAKGWFALPAIYAFIVYKTFDRKTFVKLSIPLFATLMLVSVWALLQKVGLISTLFYQVNDSSFSLYLSEGRSFGPFESPNYLAMFLSPVFFLSLPFFDLVKKKSTRLFFGGMMILPLLAIYFTNSRGGVISTVICVFVYLNYRYINHRSANKVRPFHQIVFTFLLVFINAAYLFYATRFVNVSSGGDSVRIEIYKYSLKILKSDWLLGTGLGNFQGRIGQISVGNFSFQEYALGYALHPHNLLLAVWLNLGLLGLIAAVYLIIIFFKKCFNSVEMIRASLIAAMFAILIHGLFDTTYFKNDLSAIFWLLIAGAFVLNRRQGVEIEE